MKKLYRSKKNKSIFGVLAGLAEYFDLDVSLLRILYIILALWRLEFLIVYLVAALVIPKEPDEDKTDDSVIDTEVVE